MLKEGVRIGAPEAAEQTGVNCSLESANRLVEVADGIRRIEETLIVSADICDDAVLDFAEEATNFEKL